MSIVLFILALAAAFIGTIFAFRAVHRIHNGESYTYESTACAVCVTLIVLALMLSPSAETHAGTPEGAILARIGPL